MSFSEDNLDTACTYSENAYNDNIVGATKIECERTSTTAFVHRTPHLDIVVFRGTQQLRDWMYNVLSFPDPTKADSATQVSSGPIVQFGRISENSWTLPKSC